GSGLGKPLTPGRLECPRPRRREPGRCVPVAAIPSMQPAAPCRLSEGPKAPRWTIGTATLITFLLCDPRIREAGQRLASYSLPRRKPPRGIALARFFLWATAAWRGASPLAAASGRGQRLSGSSLGLV